ncbi:hypothetical protein L210DRAFT_3387460, partial [Boletus edulis BED1]
QCIDNQSHFDSGTASTVFFQPNAPPAPPLCNHTVQEYYSSHFPQIYNLAYLAALSQYTCDVFHVLQFLINSPDFDFTSYQSKNNVVFASHTHFRLLSTGPSYVTHQFMLGIECLEEASYKGNINVINTILHQLKLDIENEMRPHDSQILDLDECK